MTNCGNKCTENSDLIGSTNSYKPMKLLLVILLRHYTFPTKNNAYGWFSRFRGPFLEAPANYPVLFSIPDRNFKSSENYTVKLSAKETKWTSLEVRTHPTFLEILISKYGFGPVKFPGLSRNGPLFRSFKPFNPDLNKYILLTGLLVFLILLVQRIWFNIKTFYVDDHFLYSHNLC